MMMPKLVNTKASEADDTTMEAASASEVCIEAEQIKNALSRRSSQGQLALKKHIFKRLSSSLYECSRILI
jgi:hypothetical protein